MTISVLHMQAVYQTNHLILGHKTHYMKNHTSAKNGRDTNVQYVMSQLKYVFSQIAFTIRSKNEIFQKDSNLPLVSINTIYYALCSSSCGSNAIVKITAIGTAKSTPINPNTNPHNNIQIKINSALTPSVLFIIIGVRILFSD